MYVCMFVCMCVYVCVYVCGIDYVCVCVWYRLCVYVCVYVGGCVCRIEYVSRSNGRAGNQICCMYVMALNVQSLKR